MRMFLMQKMIGFKGTALLEDAPRHLSAPPIFFGLVAFGILALLLYFVLRLDRD